MKEEFENKGIKSENPTMNLDPSRKLPPMVILSGPTGVGKTKLSISLAKAIDGEIISADSVQVYEGMDVGSAKIKPEEMEGIPHHLIDVLKPWQDFNVVTFQSLCKEALKGIYDRGRIPIVVGGTGFYVQALLRNVNFTENEENAEFRERLEKIASEKGPEALHEMLRKVDPKSAEAIHANNVKRTIRALEYYELTKMPISEHNEEEKRRERAYNACYFVLNDKRERLYAKIDSRVDEMMRDGLLKEVKGLKEMGCKRGSTAMQGLGYKEILDYLEGELTLEEAVEKIKLSTRHFCKRQLTWFRREPDVIWLNKWEYDYDEKRILEEALNRLRAQGILLS